MTSTIKVNTIKDIASTDIIKKCGTSITVGTASDTTTVAGNAVRSNALQASDGANIVSQVGTTITLGATGDNIVLAGGATQSGFGRTGTVDWQTGSIKTATFTAANGEGYFANTSGGAFNMNLPAGVAGAIVSVSDYAATWQTNNLTIVPNGTDKIGGQNENAKGNVQGQSITLVFVDSTQGWINTMDSTSNVRGLIQYMTGSVSGTGNTLATVDTNFKIATFTGPGTFTVCSVSTVDATRNKIDYVVVAAGSGGGQYAYGAGGGAGGGFRESYTAEIGGPYTASPLATPTSLPVSVQGYPIAIGSGGAGAPSGSSQAGGPGGVSSFSTITSTGGGKPGAGTPSSGCAGGSGGGGGGGSSGDTTTPAGAGNTPPVSPPQGNPGGTGRGYPVEGIRRGGGGGGAGSAGQAGTYPAGGSNGGAGVSTGAKSSPAGGTGAGGYSGGAAGSGGTGPFNGTPGGFGSGASGFGNGGNGATNSGAGGGASGANGSQGNGGNGGSGVVVIRFRFQ